MNSLLENQKIRKRKSPGLSKPGMQAAGFSGVKKSNSSPVQRGKNLKPAFRPKGIISLFEQNSRLIDNVKQEPVRIHRVKKTTFAQRSERRIRPSIFASSLFRNSGNLKQNFPGFAGVEEDGSPVNEHKGFSFFNVPAIPASALLILGLGLFFILHGSGALAWMDREVVESEKDSGSQYNLALYAGIQTPELSKEKIGDEIPLDLMETFEWQSYKVKKGDSVSKIASDFSISMDAIIASNGISNARALREGEVLRIPNMDGIPYTVKNGDSLSGISQSMGVPLEAILDANDLQDDNINPGLILFIPGARMNREDLRLALGELFIYPLKGARLSSPYGWRNDPFTGVRSFHAAIDLSSPQGTPIMAAMDGKVSTLGYNATYGNYIILSHSSPYQTMYAHLYSFNVKKGDAVRQGSIIGAVGTTGYSTGPHLHFAVFKSGKAVNPLDFLNPSR